MPIVLRRRSGPALCAKKCLPYRNWSATPGKQHPLARTTRHFLTECRVCPCPCRFDVMAIDNSPAKPPVVRLHKDTFSPQNVEFHRKILRNDFSPPPDAVQSEPGGRFPCPNL